MQKQIKNTYPGKENPEIKPIPSTPTIVPQSPPDFVPVPDKNSPEQSPPEFIPIQNPEIIPLKEMD